MSVFYTSDHHYFHEGIIRLVRPEFPSVEAMNEHLIERWNSVVKPDDTVYHLGDFSIKPSVVPDTLARLNGNTTIIGGNHEGFWTGHFNQTKAANSLARYQDMGFAAVHPTGQLLHELDGHQVLLSHLPYYGDSQRDERYVKQRPKDEGLPIVCGHIHRTWAKMYGDGKIHRGQVHIGVDAWDYTPVPQDELISTLHKARPDVFGETP